MLAFTLQMISYYLLVSTYIVCERLSVMHEPAGVVEILVQILQFTPILNLVQNTPPLKKIKIVTESKSKSFRIPPQNENCHRVQVREFQNTPPK